MGTEAQPAFEGRMKMRKYRGLTKDSKWVYGWYVFTDGKHYICYDEKHELQFVEVILETVGQYTGLRDKNGAEIYAGDWVKIKSTDDSEFKGYVAFRDGSFMVNAGYIVGYRWIDYEIEIIGNIHQYPKLMESNGK